MTALTVVRADGRAVGVVPPAALLTVLAHEHHEDLHRLVGILHERRSANAALEELPLRRAARRLPWLLVGATMSVVMTALMATFEADLERNVMIAFFIPAIVYLADASGGLDPAFGSGPVAAMLQDGLTIVIYFLVMSVALPA